MIAKTPTPPYYAVIFTSIGAQLDQDYQETSARMEELAQKEPGFLGLESARSKVGLTVSYWDSLDSIKHWKMNVEHELAREKGRSSWYQSFGIRISKVERDYFFEN